MFNKIKNLSNIPHFFGTGNFLYYACLYPKFDWFDKEFSIKQIIEPTKLRILNYMIVPSIVDKDDRFNLLKYDLKNVVRKYILTVYLEKDIKFISTIFEAINKSFLISNDKHIIIDNISKEVVNVPFYRLVMKTKLELDRSGVKIIRDNNFEYFKELYSYGKDAYPEELIKLQSKKDYTLFFEGVF